MIEWLLNGGAFGLLIGLAPGLVALWRHGAERRRNRRAREAYARFSALVDLVRAEDVAAAQRDIERLRSELASAEVQAESNARLARRVELTGSGTLSAQPWAAWWPLADPRRVAPIPQVPPAGTTYDKQDKPSAPPEPPPNDQGDLAEIRSWDGRTLGWVPR